MRHITNICMYVYIYIYIYIYVYDVCMAGDLPQAENIMHRLSNAPLYPHFNVGFATNFRLHRCSRFIQGGPLGYHV